MSNLPSVKQKVQTESTRYLSSTSEFLVQTVGKSINWLIDRIDAIDSALAGQNVSAVVPIGQQDTVGGTLTYTAPAGKSAYVTLNCYLAGNGGFTVTIATPQIVSSTFASAAVPSGGTAISLGVYLAPGQGVSIGGAVANVSGIPVVQIYGIEYETVNLTVP
jgi:hypothetical protein